MSVFEAFFSQTTFVDCMKNVIYIPGWMVAMANNPMHWIILYKWNEWRTIAPGAATALFGMCLGFRKPSKLQVYIYLYSFQICSTGGTILQRVIILSYVLMSTAILLLPPILETIYLIVRRRLESDCSEHPQLPSLVTLKWIIPNI